MCNTLEKLLQKSTGDGSSPPVLYECLLWTTLGTQDAAVLPTHFQIVFSVLSTNDLLRFFQQNVGVLLVVQTCCKYHRSNSMRSGN
jgi:hypothetical protein